MRLFPSRPSARRLARLAVLAALPLVLASCGDLPALSSPAAPDLRVRLVPSPSGRGSMVLPPDCSNFQTTPQQSPFDNTIPANMGCANARNLAAQIDNPDDLVQGRTMGARDGDVAGSSVARYKAGKTTALINPQATAPQTIIKMEDSSKSGNGS